MKTNTIVFFFMDEGYWANSGFKLCERSDPCSILRTLNANKEKILYSLL